MEALREAFDAFEAGKKRLEIHSTDKETVEEFETQFATKNLAVAHEPAGPGEEDFIIIRDADGLFQGAVGVEQFRGLLSPPIETGDELSNPECAEMFDFLEHTMFKLTKRRALLAASREIEDRALRSNSGSLYAGFQHAVPFKKQSSLYDRFALGTEVSVRIFVEDEWNIPPETAVDVVGSDRDEIGRFWFVLYDGGENPLQACGLVAEEREPDTYYGFWTYDDELVAEMITYLDSSYGAP